MNRTTLVMSGNGCIDVSSVVVSHSVQSAAIATNAWGKATPKAETPLDHE
jgi:hypothetical protein